MGLSAIRVEPVSLSNKDVMISRTVGIMKINGAVVGNLVILPLILIDMIYSE